MFKSFSWRSSEKVWDNAEQGEQDAELSSTVHGFPAHGAAQGDKAAGLDVPTAVLPTGPVPSTMRNCKMLMVQTHERSTWVARYLINGASRWRVKGIVPERFMFNYSVQESVSQSGCGFEKGYVSGMMNEIVRQLEELRWTTAACFSSKVFCHGLGSKSKSKAMGFSNEIRGMPTHIMRTLNVLQKRQKAGMCFTDSTNSFLAE